MKVVSIVGARPQFIKLAPFAKEIKNYPLEHLIVHTGQHYDYNMSMVFFDQLGIPRPDYHLEVGSGTHGYQTGEMLKRIEEVLLETGPRWVVVYGDTNSTLAGALSSAKLQIPLAHVEAGLRSYNRRMPEEINRVVADHLSTVLFCPTETAVANLRREGFENVALGGKFLGHGELSQVDFGRQPFVANIGDIMCDSLNLCMEIAQEHSVILDTHGLSPKSYFLATIHRAENTDSRTRLKNIFSALAELGKDKPVIVPLHPRTRKIIESAGELKIDAQDIMLIDPVSYFDMLILEKNAELILTDSGGIQKEAFLLGVPCVTMREETEWTETVESGWNTLAGTVTEAIVRAAKAVKVRHKPPICYGTGKTAQTIAWMLSAIAAND